MIFHHLISAVGFFLFGASVGVLGTLVGVGGGFLIVPVLSMLEPHWAPRMVTAFSLAVVTTNATSGTVAYLRQRRVDVQSVRVFALVAMPAALGGVFIGNSLSSALFNRIFGFVLIAMALWLLMPKRLAGNGLGGTHRQIIDASGEEYQWSFDMRLGVAGSLVVGISSALFGIGGGPINVPFLITVLNYPAHIATATSHGILALTSITAMLVHLVQGDYAHDAPSVLATAAGALTGAPFGARLSGLVSGTFLLRSLAVMLAIIAVEMLAR